MGRPRVALEERLWNRVEKDGASGCWLWLGSLDHGGYGRISLGGAAAKLASVHRTVYEMLVGPIPEGLTVDHKCRVRHCCNPDHLQVVSNSVNLQNQGPRSDSRTGVRGVYRDPRDGSFVARAAIDGKRHRAGTFATLAEAEDAAIALRNRLMSNNLLDRTAS